MLMTSIGDIPYFRSLEGRYVLVDLFLLITRNWTLHDMLNLCTSELSTLRQHPVSRISESLVDFVLDRVMINQPPTNLNIEAAANRIYLEMVPYINIFVSEICFYFYYTTISFMDLKANLIMNNLAMFRANSHKY